MEEADADTLHIPGALGRQAETGADLRSTSSLDVELVLRRASAVDRPVDLAVKLKEFGLSLGEAHKALNRIVADEDVSLKLHGADPAAIIAQLHDLGVSARER